MSADLLQRRWYVLHTRSRFENVVYEGLHKKSLEVFLPKVLVRSKRRDRRQMIRVPLFPGYVFVKTDLDPREHVNILKTVGAVRLIGNQDGPVRVPEENIKSLEIITAEGKEIYTGTRFKKGDRVVVVHGPFTGVIGVFVRYRGEDRIIVNVEALGRFAAVEISADDVEAAPEIMA